MSKQATIREVAAKANVSTATVSRVLNSRQAVSDDVRRAVQEAIHDLGYQPRKGSLAFRTDTLRIALVVSDITNPYFPLLIRGVGSVSAVEGCELLLYNCDGDSSTEKAHYKRITACGVDGIICIPFSERTSGELNRLIEQRFPIVFLDRTLPRNDICSVTSDNEEGAYQATTYLLHLGHRRILYVAGPSHYSTTVARTAGFKNGLLECGLEMDNDLVLQGDTTSETAYKLMINRLDHGRPDFTAVFASNDLMAYGIWQALEDRKYKVPKDISIVGYDDVPYSSYRQLTTIAQPSYETGRNALLLLIDLIARKREPPVNLVLRDSLIIRKSCARPVSP